MKVEHPGPCPQKEQWGLTDDAIKLAEETLSFISILESKINKYVIISGVLAGLVLVCFVLIFNYTLSDNIRLFFFYLTLCTFFLLKSSISKWNIVNKEIKALNNDIIKAYVSYIAKVRDWRRAKDKYDKIETIRKKLALKSYWQTFIGMGRAFEIEFSELLKNLGFIEVILTQASNDGGVDIIAFTASYRIAVQCKAHSKPSGPAHVRELYGVVCGDGYKYGMLVNPSGFTKNAKEFAKGKNLYLVDLDGICKMAMRI